MKEIKLPKDIFNLDEEPKKKKKKKSSKKKKDGGDIQVVFLYGDIVSAAMASNYDSKIEIPRYNMRPGQYTVVERNGDCDLDKIKSIQFSVKDESVSSIMSHKYVKKRINIKNSVCYAGVDYTVIRLKFDEFREILNYSIGLPANQGVELTKVFTNLSGVHDAQILGKKKKVIGTVIR